MQRNFNLTVADQFAYLNWYLRSKRGRLIWYGRAVVTLAVVCLGVMAFEILWRFKGDQKSSLADLLLSIYPFVSFGVVYTYLLRCFQLRNVKANIEKSKAAVPVGKFSLIADESGIIETDETGKVVSKPWRSVNQISIGTGHLFISTFGQGGFVIPVGLQQEREELYTEINSLWAQGRDRREVSMETSTNSGSYASELSDIKVLVKNGVKLGVLILIALSIVQLGHSFIFPTASTWGADATQMEMELTLSKVRLEKNAGGELILLGEIESSSEVRWHHTTVRANLFDAAGKFVDQCSIVLDESVPANALTYFKGECREMTEVVKQGDPGRFGLDAKIVGGYRGEDS